MTISRGLRFQFRHPTSPHKTGAPLTAPGVLRKPTDMRERGLMNLGFSGASHWSASGNFWVDTFSTGTMGSFQPELTSLPLSSNIHIGSETLIP